MTGRTLVALTAAVTAASSVSAPQDEAHAAAAVRVLPTAVIRGTDDFSCAPHGCGNVYAPDLVRHADRLWMFYGAQGHDGHDRILLATSADGNNWVRQGVVLSPAGLNHVNDPSVAIVGGKWFMFYTRAE